MECRGVGHRRACRVVVYCTYYPSRIGGWVIVVIGRPRGELAVNEKSLTEHFGWGNPDIIGAS